jgi:cytochrome c oxidase cbb3-type subunit 4
MIDSGVIAGVVTGLLLLAFVGVAIWAYRPARRERFEHAAELPFADEEAS